MGVPTAVPLPKVRKQLVSKRAHSIRNGGGYINELEPQRVTVRQSDPTGKSFKWPRRPARG